MAKTLKFTSYGKDYKVSMNRTSYSSNKSLAIMCIVVGCTDEDSFPGEPYGFITTNVPGVGGNIVALDDNNAPDACAEFMKHIVTETEEDGTNLDIHGNVIEEVWGRWYGMTRSGYCEYHLVKLTDEFINSLDSYK